MSDLVIVHRRRLEQGVYPVSMKPVVRDLLVEVERLREEQDDAIYEAAVIIGEAVNRPLWGSLQGDWPDRAAAWYEKFDVPGVMGRRAAALGETEAE